MMAAAVEGVGIYQLAHPADASAASAGAPGALSAPPEAAGGHAGADPNQYGITGSGGQPSAETLVLLRDRNVTFDADGISDLRAGRIDPRIVSVLTTLSRDHRITISAMCSDHPKLTAGGSISNHHYGRAVDIATVDGQPVGPGNQAAKQVAIALERLNARIRPSEIGSPWALSGPAYFTDAAHQNHLHVGFDDPISPTWQPPQSAAPEATPAAPGHAPAPAPAPRASPAAGDGNPAGDDSGADDGNVREDGGSGDTEAEADDESDGGDIEDQDGADADASDDGDDAGDANDAADENSSEVDGGDGDGANVTRLKTISPEEARRAKGGGSAG